MDTPRRYADVVVRELHIPPVPAGWHGFLVLVEAQNLSDRHSEYVMHRR